MTQNKGAAQVEQQKALDQALTKLSIPEGYVLKDTTEVKQDSVNAWVFRYEKSSGENNGMGGEHYSFTVTQDTHKILGMIWLSQDFEKGQPLLSHEETTNIVKAFLQKVEPGLFERSENRWIRPEDFSIRVSGKDTTLTGVRYKLYVPTEGKWGWVIVAPDGNVMTFEQDMIWMGGRISEMWLHDHWVSSGANSSKMKTYIKDTLRKLR
ncbi:hypothetical protein L1889_12610 [Paenalcaligenes niemegkensis]|uniref:hypothetical protein n=1 Tax=Paenalcaligenes niemegkensis TaxID=2895469 RepID=UPI001EE833D6|nr:hypothetical protein [Paenalcaligenes niemegkensis]MCQ9617426.1 hypothetical protein [Paenalcaligenes niemegkensis]